MLTHKEFEENFNRLLKDISGEFSLAEWQFIYRQVIFATGFEILKRFPRVAVAPDPFDKRPEKGGGHGQQYASGGEGGDARQMDGGGQHGGSDQQVQGTGGGGRGGAGGGVRGAGPIINPDSRGGGSSGGGQPAFIDFPRFVLGLQLDPDRKEA